MDLELIFENNRKWVAEKLEHDEQYFKQLAKGQNPDMLYIGCSDSRVTAEDMMGAQPGDLFVHRNIANVVPTTDINSLSVINYAVVHLQVEHIVVCGHYGCGGVKAAMQVTNMGILNPWLRCIRDVYRMHADQLKAIDDDSLRYDRLVELNVQEQCINVLKAPEVLLAHKAKKLTIHGWVFDIATGKIKDLNIDFDPIIKRIVQIYKVT